MSVPECSSSNEFRNDLNMAVIRASLRLVIIFILILLGTLIILSFKLYFIPGSVFIRVKNKLLYWFSSITIWLLNIRLTIKGNPPEPPFFLVSNHLSYLEIILFWNAVPCTFIAKADIKSWPLFGFIAQLIGVHFIDRSNNRDIPRLNRNLSDSINDHQGVVLFPEGTSTRGEKVLPFKSPLFQYPASQGTAVSTASITYATHNHSKPASEYVCWWGDMDFFDHFFELLKLSKLEAAIVFGDEEFINKDRKRLAYLTYQTVKKNFVPVTDHLTYG